MEEPTTPSDPLMEKNHCFTVDVVQQTCTKVWVRVNIHFFLDDNCEGTLDPLGNVEYPIEDAYQLAESIIEEANLQLGDDLYQQWVQIPLWGITTVKPKQCVPVRYALSGVYIHCDEAARTHNGYYVDWFRNNFAVNTDTEFNAFFVESTTGTVSGIADGVPGRSMTAETFSRGLFNHEMGHVLDLHHAQWPSDDCDDTPPVNYQIDYNCDGDTDDDWTSTGGLDEGFTFIGLWCHPGAGGCNDLVFDPIDYDGDGIIDYQDPCDPALIASGCLPEPGCLWDYYSNNIMQSSSGYVHCCGAITENQITRMLNQLSTPDGCEYIEVITDDICLPPMANIHILPTESVEEDCAFCFQIGASVNDPFF